MTANRQSGMRVTALNIAYDGRPAVADVSFEVKPAGSLCLVGESAAGKSSISAAVLRVLPANATTSGEILLGETRLGALTERAMREVRRRRIGLIPQDSRGSLMPHTRVGKQVGRILSIRLGLARGESERVGKRQLAAIGLNEVDRVWDSTPDQLSGGMCQRVLLAIALSSDPELLIADEPLTSVDAPAQVELLRLILDLHSAKGFIIIMITHDLRIARRFEEIGVLKDGRLVEMGRTDSVLAAPVHPYTKCLIKAARELGNFTN